MSQISEYFRESFSEEERSILGRFFTNIDGPVFALKNLPEVVKGALFARYSRSPKSLRRLFLDEFVDGPGFDFGNIDSQEVGISKAADLYRRVFYEYGDDSVAQLGGAHVACEQASNILTKVLERGRLASYLEQSTRYIYFNKKIDGRYRYLIPPELRGTPFADLFIDTIDSLFDLYSSLSRQLEEEYDRRFPPSETVPASVRRQTIRARVCDDLRGLLPASTISNLGIFASGQAFESLLLRMRSHPLQEVRYYSGLLLAELKKVLPDFVRRVEIPDRGIAWSEYLRGASIAIGSIASELATEERSSACEAVSLVDWDPDGEIKVIAGSLYGSTCMSDSQLLALIRDMSPESRENIFWAYVGNRENRRHRPGRAMERTFYRFDLITDYGIFRDLQRHRMLTTEWQLLTPYHGYVMPDIIKEMGWVRDWVTAMDRVSNLYERLKKSFGAEVAQYALPFSYKIRFYLQFNAREAFHLLELRSQKGGHDAYRQLCWEIHRQIAEVAGHKLISAAMKFVDYDEYEFGRLESERRALARRELSASSIDV
jgi:thymidylate synthase ThyX